jgi:hypothetical protein
VRRGYRNAIRNSPQMANSSSESRELDILSVRQKGGKCGKGCWMGNAEKVVGWEMRERLQDGKHGKWEFNKQLVER